jgi:hypothetical protein
MSRNRRARVNELLVLREAPYDTLATECSGCGQPALDDPFPYWSKCEPDLYVSWAVTGGGNRGFGCSYSFLRSFSGRLNWSAVVVGGESRESFEAAHARNAQKPSVWLIRNDAELGTLPGEVEFRCPSCSQTKLMQAKWTIQEHPTLLSPYLRCLGTKDRKWPRQQWTLENSETALGHSIASSFSSQKGL